MIWEIFSGNCTPDSTLYIYFSPASLYFEIDVLSFPFVIEFATEGNAVVTSGSEPKTLCGSFPIYYDAITLGTVLWFERKVQTIVAPGI